ncbi:MAG: hypothetical protein ABIQ38_06845 [Ilumatobacteraceae bacterium]
MHPIERLRYVARATDADPAALVGETAMALRDLRIEPAGLVLACRRIIERHPTVGPMWWLCARLLSSTNPFELAEELAFEISHDATAATLAEALSPDSTLCLVGWSYAGMQAAVQRGDCRVLVIDSQGDGQSAVNALERANVEAEYVALESAAGAILSSDTVVIEAIARGPGEALCVGGSHGVASIAYCMLRPAWLLSGVGTKLPDIMWSAMKERTFFGRQAWEVGTDVVPIELFTSVIGPAGIVTASPQEYSAECEPMPELLRRSAM